MNIRRLGIECIDGALTIEFDTLLLIRPQKTGEFLSSLALSSFGP